MGEILEASLYIPDSRVITRTYRKQADNIQTWWIISVIKSVIFFNIFLYSVITSKCCQTWPVYQFSFYGDASMHNICHYIWSVFIVIKIIYSSNLSHWQLLMQKNTLLYYITCCIIILLIKICQQWGWKTVSYAVILTFTPGVITVFSNRTIVSI